MSLSENIRHFRKDNDMAQEYVAEKLNMSQATYSRIEHSDRRCASMLLKLAQAMDTTSDILRNYHRVIELAIVPETVDSVNEVLFEKEAIIEHQAAEITFLKRYVGYVQAVLRHYSAGQDESAVH